MWLILFMENVPHQLAWLWHCHIFYFRYPSSLTVSLLWSVCSVDHPITTACWTKFPAKSNGGKALEGWFDPRPWTLSMMQGREKLSTNPEKINYLDNTHPIWININWWPLDYVLITVSSSLGDATICKFKFRTPRLQGFVIEKLNQSQRPKIFLLVKLPYLWFKLPLPYLWKTVHSYWKMETFLIAMVPY